MSTVKNIVTEKKTYSPKFNPGPPIPPIAPITSATRDHKYCASVEIYSLYIFI